MQKAQINIIVKGLVQGVSYRYNTHKIATSLGLVGTVSNKRDGSVRIIAQGPKAQLEELAEWCKEGPQYARVSSFRISWEEIEDHFTNEFKII